MQKRGNYSHFGKLKRGFTIIELLTVLVIIGLLTSLAATSYVNAQKNARDNARKTNVNNIATAVETYYKANQDFPGFVGNETGIDTAWYPTIAASARGCAAYWADKKSIGYYYYPTSESNVDFYAKPCGSSSRPKSALTVNGKAVYDPADYSPKESWIPGLGAYLNPIPIERRYSANGIVGDTSAPLDGKTGNSFTCENDFLNVNGTLAMTIEYRKLVGGYMVYTNLENVPADAPDATALVYAADTYPKYAGSADTPGCEGSPQLNKVFIPGNSSEGKNKTYLIIK